MIYYEYVELCYISILSFICLPRAVVPNLGPPDILGLQLPKAFTTTSAGQDFWELKSKNIWRPKVEDHCSSTWDRDSPTYITPVVPH